MTVTKRINRKALTKAVKETLSEQRNEARRITTELVNQEMQMDERVLVLRSLQELHPSMKDLFEKTIEELIQEAQNEAVKDMPSSWICYSEENIIRGRLELMTDVELAAYTLEELTDIVKSK